MSSSALQNTIDTIYLEEPTKAVFKHNSIMMELIEKETTPKPEHVCRVCLEPCPNVRFCKCSGGLLIHEQCLLEFLTVKIKKQRVRSSQLKCQICQYSYEIEINQRCVFSIEQCNVKIYQNRARCGFYSLFFLGVLIYYGSMAYLFDRDSFSQVTKISLIIVTASLSIIFFLFLGVWISQYLFKITQGQISKVIILNDRKPKSSKIHPMPNELRSIAH